MILNVSGRTDIVQYYSKWLLKRFEEGYVLSRNPIFKNKVTRYELTPDKVDCVVFASKNYKPILNDINKISERFNTYFHYTITAYGKDIEPNVPDISDSIDTLLKLEKIVGKNKIAWRYDPVLLTDKYTIEKHSQTFEYIAKKLAGHIDRCMFNFIETHRKLQKNMPDLITLTDEDKERLAEGFGKIADKYNINIQSCRNNGDFTKYNVTPSGCITLDILGEANDAQFKKLKHKGLRKSCSSMESRDIGSYESCPSCCRYCYANTDSEKISENYKMHDRNSSILLGSVKETDDIKNGIQKSFLKK